jgi:hypothetical protein
MTGGLVRVYASVDPFDAELMRGRLEAEGLNVMLKGEGEGPYRSGPMYLWVPADEADTASAVVDAVASGAFALPEEEGAGEGGDTAG